MSYHLGIDLGTTYTAAAAHEGGRVEVVPLGDRGPSIPSVLYLKPDGTVVAGDAANRHAVTDPERIAREFKRRLGDPTPIQLGGVATPPELLTGHLLRWVYDTVVRAKGAAPASVVLTHPANWGPYKRDLLTRAAQGAGLAQVTLVTEPQAAAISYASQARVEPGAVVAVYDLGGGTFDAAVLRKEADGAFSILGSPEGIERLGGIDFDAAVFNHVIQSLEGVFEELDPEDEATVAAVARLRQECTQAKEALSVDTEATIPVLLPTTQTEVRTTRAELESMIRPTLAETISALNRALRSADLSPADVSHVLLVGGSSRIPLIAGLVSAELGRPVAVDAHPKHAVALGAAIVAARVAGVNVGDAARPQPMPTAVPAGVGTAAAGAAAGVAAASLAPGAAAPPAPRAGAAGAAPSGGPQASAGGPAGAVSTPAGPPPVSPVSPGAPPPPGAGHGAVGQPPPRPAPPGQAGPAAPPAGPPRPPAPGTSPFATSAPAPPPPGAPQAPGGSTPPSSAPPSSYASAPPGPGGYGAPTPGPGAPGAPPPGYAGPSPGTGGPPPPPPGTTAGRSGWDPTFDAAATEAPGPSLGYRSAAMPPPPGTSTDLPPGYATQEQRDRQRRRKRRKGRVRVVVGALVLLACVAVTLALTAQSNQPDTLADVEASECFRGEDFDDVDIVSCTEPHRGQLVAVLDPPDPNVDYPGAQALVDALGEPCAVEVEAFFGAGRDVLAGLDPPLNIYRIPPTEEQWNDDAKGTFCYVGHATEGENFTGTIEGEGANLPTTTAPPAP